MNDTDEDRAAIKPLVNQINGYPLTEFDGQVKIKDWDDVPHFPTPEVEGENKWVMPEPFFDQLPGVMDAMPPLPWRGSSLCKHPPGARGCRKRSQKSSNTLVRGCAVETEQGVIEPLFLWKHNGIPAGNGWNRSANNAQWGVDYLMRTSTARSNMFDNRPTETQYFYTDGDSQGVQLEGQHLYTVTFPEGGLPLVKGFWSMTIYNKYHLFEVNDLNRYSLGTKNKDLKFNPDGSLTLYAVRSPPAKIKKQTGFLPLKEPSRSISAAIGEKKQFSTAVGNHR